MMRFFWYWFARTGIFVSVAFAIFDLAIADTAAAAIQTMLLIGYLWLAWFTRPAYKQFQLEQQRHLRSLENEGDALERRIAELERELGIGDQS